MRAAAGRSSMSWRTRVAPVPGDSSASCLRKPPPARVPTMASAQSALGIGIESDEYRWRCRSGRSDAPRRECRGRFWSWLRGRRQRQRLDRGHLGPLLLSAARPAEPVRRRPDVDVHRAPNRPRRDRGDLREGIARTEHPPAVLRSSGHRSPVVPATSSTLPGGRPFNLPAGT